MIPWNRLSWTRRAAAVLLALLFAWIGVQAWGAISFARRLRAVGYTAAAGETQPRFLEKKVRQGATFERVASMLPAGAEKSYHLLAAGADSLLVQRFAYGIGQGMVDVYYDRSGTVVDVYVDSPPGLDASRRVSEHEARVWLRAGAEPVAATDTVS
jgi:hypothetical protein